MIILVVTQFILQLFLAGGLYWLHRELRQSNPKAQRDRMDAHLNVLKHRVEEQQAQWLRLKSEVESQLHSLQGIGVKAATILEKNQFALGASTPSLEERELRAATQIEIPQEPEKIEIPTLEDIEATRLRLTSETAFDLKTILKEQIA